jgi:hypothetical protein
LDDPYPRFDHEFFRSWYFAPFVASYNPKDFARVFHYYNQVPLKLRLSHSQLLRLHSPVCEKEEWSTYLRHWFDLFNVAFFLGSFDHYPSRSELGSQGITTLRIHGELTKWLCVILAETATGEHRFRSIYRRNLSVRNTRKCILRQLLTLLHEILHAFFQIFPCGSSLCTKHYNLREDLFDSHGPEWADCMRVLLDALEKLANWPEADFNVMLYYSVLNDTIVNKWQPTPS